MQYEGKDWRIWQEGFDEGLNQAIKSLADAMAECRALRRRRKRTYSGAKR